MAQRKIRGCLEKRRRIENSRNDCLTSPFRRNASRFLRRCNGRLNACASPWRLRMFHQRPGIMDRLDLGDPVLGFHVVRDERRLVADAS